MYLGVSGIMAIVTLGIFMGMFGALRINPESMHAMHNVWGFVQYAMEALVFIITGLYIGQEYIGIEENTISYTDFVKMLLFFVLMVICRFLMISVLVPLINITGYPITIKDVVILAYGGLRGAVALCLALLVVTDNYSERFKDLVLFYLIGMIILTILINGLTIKYLINFIGFMKADTIKEKFLNNLKKSLVIESLEKMVLLKQSRFYKLADWTKVAEISKLDKLVAKENEKKSWGDLEMEVLKNTTGEEGNTNQ